MLDLQEEGASAPACFSASTAASSGTRADCSLRRNFYALDAKTCEVSKVPARQPQGNRFAQSQDRFWRVWIADTRTCVDHEHAIGGRACGAHTQYETQRQVVDPHFSGQIRDLSSTGNAHGKGQRPARVLGRHGATG